MIKFKPLSENFWNILCVNKSKSETKQKEVSSLDLEAIKGLGRIQIQRYPIKLEES